MPTTQALTALMLNQQPGEGRSQVRQVTGHLELQRGSRTGQNVLVLVPTDALDIAIAVALPPAMARRVDGLALTSPQD
jgi:hypothetical protein